MAAKILNLSLVAVVLSLGFGQLLRFELFSLTFFLHDVLVIFLLSLLILQRESLQVFRRPPLWAKLIFLGLTIGALRALTLFPPTTLLIPSLYSLRLLAYLALYLLLKPSKLTLAPQVFILSASTTVLIGLWQYFYMPDMRLFQYLGWDDHLNRLTLPHFDPTYTAVSLVLPLLTLKQLPKLLYPFSLAAFLLTYARSVWLSLLLALFTRVQKLRTTVLILAFSLLAISLLPNGFGEGTNLFRTYSVSSRLNHDLALIRQVGFNAFTGVGYNSLPLLLDSQSVYSDHATSFNNSYLTILATMGPLGLIGFALLLNSLITSTNNSSTALIFVILASLFNNVLLYPFVLLWLLLANSLMAPSANSNSH